MVRKDNERKEKLIAEAKAQWTKQQLPTQQIAPDGSGRIVFVNIVQLDMNNDKSIEAYLQQMDAESKR